MFNATGFSATPVDPEHVKSYELGVKADPLSWLRTNISGFYTDYQNMQVSARDPISTAVVLQNAASARIYGVEADVQMHPLTGLNVRLAASALSAKYVEFPQAQIFNPRPGGGNIATTFDARDTKLLRVPSLTASIATDYTFAAFAGDLTISGNMSYQDEFFWQVGGRIRQPENALFNGQIAWRSPDAVLELALWAKNLTNVQPPLSVSLGTVGDTASYSRPRSVGVRFTGHW